MSVYSDTKPALVLLMNDAFARPTTEHVWFIPKGYTGCVIIHVLFTVQDIFLHMQKM